MMEKDIKEFKKMYYEALPEDFSESFNLSFGSLKEKLEKSKLKLRYGTNPNQRAALYVKKEGLWSSVKEVKTGKSGLSQTNIEDLDRALRILKYFNEPSCAVMKHLIPSGFAAAQEGDTVKTIYVKARDCDSKAAFGGVIVFNCEVDGEAAEEMKKSFIEVVAAPSFSEDALKIFQEKKNLRVVQYELNSLKRMSRFSGESLIFEVKSLIDGSIIVSDEFLTKVKSEEDFKVVTKMKPSEKELKDLIFSWYVCIGVRSNGIVIAKDKCTISIGSGQQDRVTAVKLSIDKALDRGHKDKLNGSVLASDGFFPFRDSIDLIAKYGVKNVIQPGGSVMDEEVIKACNEYGIAMVFTGERCFSHF
jgi:phosphoribosylaminoimidazolecarboxamide formyltransferase/IMP cyclohydrolase